MRTWNPLVTVCLSTLMLLVDITIVSVAVPSIADDLNASLTDLNWTVDLYVLVLSAALMGFGSIADIAGRRRVYLTGLGIFALASLACGLAPNGLVLIAARGVQGLGAAAMLATNIALLAANYTGRARGIAFGVWGAVNGLAAAAGPIIGGVLTEAFGWRSIFFVNLPIAVVAFAIGARYLSESRGEPGTRVDAPGIVAFTATASLLVYGLIRAGESGWATSGTLVVFAAAAAALVAFVLLERRRLQPMLDLRLARTPSFAALMLGALVHSGAAFANLVFVSIWAQSVLGYGAVAAGLILTPLGVVAAFVSGAAGRFIGALPPRLPIGGGLLFVGAGLLLDLRIAGGSGWTVLLPGLIVTGVGVGLCSPVLASAAAAAAPLERAGMAGAAVNTLRQFGFAVGIPIATTLMVSAARPVLGRTGLFPSVDAAADAVTGGHADAVLAHLPADRHDTAVTAAHQAFAAGLDRVFLVSGLAAVITGLIVLALVRRTPPPRAAASNEAEPDTALR